MRPDLQPRPALALLLAGGRVGRGLIFCSGLCLAIALPLLVGASPPERELADLPDPGMLELEAAGDPEPSSEPSVDEDESAVELAAPEAAAPEEEASDEVAPALAEPEPVEPEVSVKVLSKAKWIKHEVIPGERLDEIADRYQVKRASLIRWNKLDPETPRIYAGRELAVYTKYIPPPKQKISYFVEYGDTWAKIAQAHGVDEDELRLAWNPKVPRKFKAGQEIVIWIDPLASADFAGGGSITNAGKSVTKAALPLAKIPRSSISVGKPNRGKLVNSAALPENPKLYTIRKPGEAYGSTHTLTNLQVAIANWRQASGFDRELIIGAISKQGGGKLKPHSSHQSGRDVDIRLPTKKGISASKIPENASQIDWDAAWGLVAALAATGEIQYIFLSSSRQKYLYEAARRAGVGKDELEQLIQYPNNVKGALVRHAKGHDAHIHVRFNCAANETKCESY